MRVAIEVKDKGEATAIKAALEDPITRALVVTVGLLKPLDDGGRRRVMNFVIDKFELVDKFGLEEGKP